MSGKKLSKNIVIYGLSNGLKSLVPFVMLPILTNYFSAEGYGLLAIIETSLLFLTPFIILNIEGFISVEYFKSNKETLSRYISNGILISICSFIFTSILFFFLKDFLSHTLDIPPYLILLLPVMVIVKLIPTVLLVILQAKQKAVSYLAYSVSQTLVDFGLSAVFIMVLMRGFRGRLEGIYGAFFLFSIIGATIMYRMGYLKFSIGTKKIKHILNFGLPLIPHAIGGTAIALSDRYFVSYFEGNAEVGFYTAGYQISALMLLFSRSVNQAWNPMLFNLLSKRNYTPIKKITFLLFVAFLTVGLLTYFLSDFLFDLLVNVDFHAAKNYFPYLLLGFVLQSFYFLFSGFIFYVKKTKILAMITFSGAILNLVLNYFLIQEYGVLGVAYSTVITWFGFLVSTFLVFQFSIRKSLFKDQV